MRILLILLIIVLFVADIFGLDIRVAPGLSMKNALLNLLAAGLAIRMAVRPGKFSFELPSLQVAMGIWFAYAVFTWLLLGMFLHFHNYNMLQSAILMKGGLLDYFIIFAVFFYGTVTNRDAIAVIWALLIGLVLANIASLISATGVMIIGENVQGEVGEEAGRIFGAFGHANETAAMTVFLLPSVIAMASISRGFARIAWAGASLICLLMLVATGSRGGYVALVLGGLWGLYLGRRYISLSRVALVASLVLIIVVPIIAALQVKYESPAISRLIETAMHPELHGADRGAIWKPVVLRMMESPWTLFTGFGWNSYDSMGFYFVTHNQYLLLWFELGLVGLVAYLFIIWRATVEALSGAASSAAESRPYLVAFAVGVPMLSVAVMFTLLFKPWLYIWAYFGVVMRLAVNSTMERGGTLHRRVSATSRAPRKMSIMSKFGEHR